MPNRPSKGALGGQKGVGLGSLSQQTRGDSLFESARQVALAIEQHTTESDSNHRRVYITGGWVRDRSLDKSSNDVDVEIFGIPPNRAVEFLCSVFPTSKIIPSTSETTPNKVILDSDHALDVTVFDKAKHGLDSRAPPSDELYLAASRRDFTCNAIYFDPLSATYFDPFGGLADIDNGILKLVPELPDSEVFRGPHVRAARHMSEFGLNPDSLTEERLRQAVTEHALKYVSPQYVQKELYKVLCATGKPSQTLLNMDQLGVLDCVFPDFKKLKYIPQDSLHHPEGSAYNHSLLVVDEAAMLTRDFDNPEKFRVMLASLLHDVGKLTTTKVITGEDGIKVTAYGHEAESARIARGYLNRLQFGRADVKAITSMVQHHMRPLTLNKVNPDEKRDVNAVRMLVRDVQPADYLSFLTVCRADILGRGGQCAQNRLGQIQNMQHVATREGFYIDPDNRLLYGEDLARLGISNTGGLYRAVITATEAARDRGRICTKTEAERYALGNFGVAEALKNAGKELQDSDKATLGKEMHEKISSGEFTCYGDLTSFIRRKTP